MLGVTPDEIVDKAVQESEEAIREVLPETWTHLAFLSASSIGRGLYAIGFKFTSSIEYAKFMRRLEVLGVLEKKGYLIRRNPIKLEEKPKYDTDYPDSVPGQPGTGQTSTSDH